MINSALLCFFATCAIFLVNPSAGGPLGVEVVAVNNNGQLFVLPPLIHVDHPRHPNQICRSHAHPKSVVIWAVMNLGEHIPDDGSFCSGRIICESRENRNLVIDIMTDMSMEGVQCRSYFESDTHRHMCIQGQCVRVNGLFPNAPTDQDEAELDGSIAKDDSETGISVPFSFNVTGRYTWALHNRPAVSIRVFHGFRQMRCSDTSRPMESLKRRRQGKDHSWRA